jgi:translocation protein SEC66
VEVVSEANSFAQGWGQVIFPTANEMLANEKIRAIYERTAETRAELGMKSHMLLQLIPIDNTFRSKI